MTSSRCVEAGRRMRKDRMSVTKEPQLHLPALDRAYRYQSVDFEDVQCLKFLTIVDWYNGMFATFHRNRTDAASIRYATFDSLSQTQQSLTSCILTMDPIQFIRDARLPPTVGDTMDIVVAVLRPRKLYGREWRKSRNELTGEVHCRLKG